MRAGIKKVNLIKNRYLMLTIIIVVITIIFSTVAKSFFTASTAMNILRQTSALSIAAIGMTMIILTGGIDLSPGAILALSGAVGAFVMERIGSGSHTFLIGIIITILTSIGIGMLNGTMIGIFKISPFMTTLATMSLARGLTMKITGSSRIMVTENGYNWFGQSDIFRVGNIGIPATVILILLSYTIAFFLMTKSTFGRKTYAIGGNPITSRSSGINVKKHIFLIYIFAAVTYSLSSIITVGRAMSAQPLAGMGFEFEVITAVVIGGTSLSGGVGSLTGTLLGSLLVGIITTGLGMVDIPPYSNYIVKGILILGAVLLDNYSSKAEKGVSIHHKLKKRDIRNSIAIENIKNNEQESLKLNNIHKSFPGVKALDGVSFQVTKGKVHALIGENGAGKSTLMKIMSGVYTKNSGEIYIDDIPVDIQSPMDSRKLGISVIYQELELIPELPVTQNIFIGKEIKKNNLLLDLKLMNHQAKELLNRFGIDINVKTRVSDFTVAQMQIIEIAKAIDSNSWVIVMDEPTAAITEAEKNKLFEIINELKTEGMAIVYISHRLSEIMEIADEVTVLRDGNHVVTKDIGQVSESDLIKYMVGRELKDIYSREKTPNNISPVIIEVKDLYKEGSFEPISFSVRGGEILGLSGLVGAGRTEIVRCLFGLDKADGGEIFINSKKVDIKNPMDGINEGICLVSEDRRREGIVPLMSIRENISLASLNRISKFSIIDKNKENKMTEEFIHLLDIKTPSSEQKIGNLSGGNQQKCCLAKWLALDPQVIILDEPTRGIDIGAKAEIHKLIHSLSKKGIAIILISSELPEIMGACDSVMVLYEGKVSGVFDQRDVINQEILMASASGIKKEDIEKSIYS